MGKEGYRKILHMEKGGDKQNFPIQAGCLAQVLAQKRRECVGWKLESII